MSTYAGIKKYWLPKNVTKDAALVLSGEIWEAII